MTDNNLYYLSVCIKKISNNPIVSVLWVLLTFITFQQFPYAPQSSPNELQKFIIHMVAVSLMTGVFLWAKTGRTPSAFMYVTSPKFVAVAIISSILSILRLPHTLSWIYLFRTYANQ